VATSNNKMKWLYAALLAGTFTLMGPPALAADQFCNVRNTFQLEGDALDDNPTSGEAVLCDPDVAAPSLVPPQPADLDDWGKFDDSASVNAGIVTDDCDDPLGGSDPESCGHVAGPDGDTFGDAGEPNDQDSLDNHDGGNSFKHFYERDIDRQKDGAGEDDIFTQGSAIVEDICEWRKTLSSTPPKDDIASAFAAFYDVTNTNPDDTNPAALDRSEAIFVAGEDVISPNGDAKVLFWLLLGDLIEVPPELPAGDPFEDFEGRFLPADFDPLTDPDPCETEGFTLHEVGDIALAIDYTNGGTVALARVFQWVADADPGPGVEEGLVQIFGPPAGEDEPDANCRNVSGEPEACGTTNSDHTATAQGGKNAPRETESPDSWDYFANLSGPNLPDTNTPDTPPDPDAGGLDDDNFGASVDDDDYPGTTFFESAANLTALGISGCFNTFLATTVSSTSLTAEMKDEVGGALALCETDVTTEVHDADHNDITGQSVPFGTAIHDEATITVSQPGTPDDPEGDVTFELFANLTCTGDPIDSEEVTITDDGLADGIATAESTPTSVLLPGDYSFLASYESTNDFPDGTGPCEPFTVTKIDSSIVTHIHAGTDHVTDIQGTSVDVGTEIHDQAVVTGAGPTPTGNVTFQLYSDAECTTADGAPEVVALDGNGEAETASFEPPAGPLSFNASYEGDDIYNPSGPSACEPLAVEKLESFIVTHIHAGTDHVTDIQGTSVDVGTEIHDQAVVTGSGDTPTGNVTFQLFSDADCTTADGAAEVVALDGNGEAETASFEPPAGALSFNASYEGDDNYDPSGPSLCEPLTVEKLDSSIVTHIHAGTDHVTDIQGGSVPVGTSIHDQAVVTGSGDTPTGNVTFQLYSDLTCTTANGAPEVVALDGNGEAETASFTPAAGSLSFNASYGGDDTYNPSGPSLCEPLTVVGLEGCTPGFWKTHTDLWFAQTGLLPTDDFDATFGVNLFTPNITLEQAINLGGGDFNKLARHAVAALLSALSPDVDYPLTDAQVIAAVQAAVASGSAEPTASQLAAFNELGCPLQ